MKYADPRDTLVSSPLRLPSGVGVGATSSNASHECVFMKSVNSCVTRKQPSSSRLRDAFESRRMSMLMVLVYVVTVSGGNGGGDGGGGGLDGGGDDGGGDEGGGGDGGGDGWWWVFVLMLTRAVVTDEALCSVFDSCASFVITGVGFGADC